MTFWTASGEALTEAVDVDLVGAGRTAWFEVVEAELPRPGGPATEVRDAVDFGDAGGRAGHTLALAEHCRRGYEELVGQRAAAPCPSPIRLIPGGYLTSRPRRHYARFADLGGPAIAFAYTRQPDWYACSLPGVVAHEVSHALWAAWCGWSPTRLQEHPETRAVVEGLGDLAALWCTFSNPAAVSDSLCAGGASLARPNRLSWVGAGPDDAFVRDLAEAPTWPESAAAMAHRRGQVLAGVAYAAFVTSFSRQVAATVEPEAVRAALGAVLRPIHVAALELAVGASLGALWPDVPAVLDRACRLAQAETRACLEAAMRRYQVPPGSGLVIA